jgi:hypothetical protein
MNCTPNNTSLLNKLFSFDLSDNLSVFDEEITSKKNINKPNNLLSVEENEQSMKYIKIRSAKFKLAEIGFKE